MPAMNAPLMIIAKIMPTMFFAPNVLFILFPLFLSCGFLGLPHRIKTGSAPAVHTLRFAGAVR
jgi:hypothetical protein